MRKNKVVFYLYKIIERKKIKKFKEIVFPFKGIKKKSFFKQKNSKKKMHKNKNIRDLTAIGNILFIIYPLKLLPIFLIGYPKMLKNVVVVVALNK